MIDSNLCSDVCLGLGSNLGDREANLREALFRLTADIDRLLISPLYETEPVDYTDQPLFLNIACRGRTRLTAVELLQRAKQIEVDMGRQPGGMVPRFGPRLIDIDILLYADRCIDTETLTIPHPRMHQRAFVLVPLADVAPEFVHPLLGKTVRELLAQTPCTGVRNAGKLP